MIFKRLKKKSNQKYLNKNLNNRKPLVDDRIIQSVGVILNNNEFRDADQLLSLLRSIDIKENKIKFNMADAKEVASYGYKAMQKGNVVAVPGVFNKFLANLPRLMPRNLAASIVRKIQEKNRED